MLAGKRRWGVINELEEQAKNWWQRVFGKSEMNTGWAGPRPMIYRWRSMWQEWTASFIHCQMRTTNDWTISCLISSAYARRNAGSYIWPVSGMPCVCSWRLVFNKQNMNRSRAAMDSSIAACSDCENFEVTYSWKGKSEWKILHWRWPSTRSG